MLTLVKSGLKYSLRGLKILQGTTPPPEIVIIYHKIRPCFPSSLLKNPVWNPAELEQKVKDCLECQSSRKLPIAACPDCPRSRVHTDYAGPFMGRMFLIIIDAHSKWLEDLPTTQVTLLVTIES